MIRLLTLSLLALAAYGITPTPPAGWTEGYVLTNGVRLHYWRTGGVGKTPLVLAHGSSDDGLCWTNLAKELTAQYDLILFDARGHGLSDPPKAGETSEAQVEDLAGLIRELKLDKPILMGHSMGSSSVAWFAAKYPAAARAIVLEDPGLVRRPGVGPAANLAPPDERRAETLRRNNLSQEDLIAGCMKGSPKWGRNECEIWAPSKRRHHPAAAFVNNADRPAVKDLFSKITVPVLILKADAQGDLRRENEEVASTLAQGKIVHIEGAGHNVRRENKAQTLEVLNAFLQGLR